jgi:hypothetical protein
MHHKDGATGDVRLLKPSEGEFSGAPLDEFNVSLTA